MSSSSHRRNLFFAHSSNLESLDSSLKDCFICPICYRLFTIDQVPSEDLTIGHIWPRDLRDRSESGAASHQQVLLCQKCNSLTGTRIDSQTQLLEQIREGDESGRLSGERMIEIIRGPAERPIQLRARLRLDQSDEIKGRISFELDQERQVWARNNPAAEERFRAISKSGEKFGMLIHPDRRLTPKLAGAGWIASSYLLAFFALGYRYILHDQVKSRVGAYIIQALYEEADTLELPVSNDFAVHETSEDPKSDPIIGLVVPAEPDKTIHLRVSFLRTEVRLPMPFVPKVLGSLLFSQLADFRERLEEVEKDSGFLYVPIRCTYLERHDCVWDYVLGKPLEI